MEGDSTSRRETGLAEIDRVLGGGLVGGAALLMAGDPGIGKSTLLLKIAGWIAARGVNVLYASGEESAGQIKVRADRLGIVEENLHVLPTHDVHAVLEAADEIEASLLIVDSVQTMANREVPASAGSVAQVRECGLELIDWAKSSENPVILVGHVTKDGQVAGPRLLEHMVDVVLSFEGERGQELRIVRGLKNRFGPTDELAVFKMSQEGLVEIDDPSLHFSSGSADPLVGTLPSVVLEGSRALIVETQALVARTEWSGGKVRATGLEPSRVSMLAAVLSSRVPGFLPGGDLFASIVGGLRVSDPAADLAVLSAIASAAARRPPPEKTAIFGEVGLSGEIRGVSRLAARLAAAHQHGIRAVVIPAVGDASHPDLELLRARTVEEALELVDLLPRSEPLGR